MSYHELENYEIEKEIGHGSFATVYKGKDKRTRKDVAIKAINTERLNKKLSENLATEISIMKEFKSQHIVELYDLQKSGKFIYLVMEYCAGGDLAGLLRKRKILPEALVRLLIRQLGEALRILFEANFAHRDLKPQNILLTYSGDERSPLLKLADFGFARFVDPADMAETLCGSPLYMAPEILRYEKYDGRADLWSVGAIMYEMIYGRPPFKAQNHIQLLKVIERSEGLPFPRTAYISEEDPEHVINASEACRELINGLLKKNPEERLTFDQFLTHPFLDQQPELEPSVTETSEPVQQHRGFNIPKHRPRIASISSATPSFKAAERRSSLTTSFKQKMAMQSAPPTQIQPQADSTMSHDILYQEESKLKTLLDGFSTARPALIQLILRDSQLGLILKSMADVNFTLLERSTEDISDSKNLLNETFQLILMAIELFQGLLKAVKETTLPAVKPTDENARNLVLWLYKNLKELHDKSIRIQRQIEGGNSLQTGGLSITSSSVCSSNGPTPSSVSDLLYNQALIFGREGGYRELLGLAAEAEHLYQRALFMLEILISPNRPAVFSDNNEPHISKQDSRVIQGYVHVIQQRSSLLGKSPV